MIRILLVALLLVGCNRLQQEKTAAEIADQEWDKAEMIDVKYYKILFSEYVLKTKPAKNHLRI